MGLLTLRCHPCSDLDLDPHIIVNSQLSLSHPQFPFSEKTYQLASWNYGKIVWTKVYINSSNTEYLCFLLSPLAIVSNVLLIFKQHNLKSYICVYFLLGTHLKNIKFG